MVDDKSTGEHDLRWEGECGFEQIEQVLELIQTLEFD